MRMWNVLPLQRAQIESVLFLEFLGNYMEPRTDEQMLQK
jgi:hypothetical protein